VGPEFQPPAAYQLRLAQALCHSWIDYLEQQLEHLTLQKQPDMVLIFDLAAIQALVVHLERILEAIASMYGSQDPPAPH